MRREIRSNYGSRRSWGNYERANFLWNMDRTKITRMQLKSLIHNHPKRWLKFMNQQDPRSTKSPKHAQAIEVRGSDSWVEGYTMKNGMMRILLKCTLKSENDPAYGKLRNDAAGNKACKEWRWIEANSLAQDSFGQTWLPRSVIESFFLGIYTSVGSYRTSME